jgi:hypothetical protein
MEKLPDFYDVTPCGRHFHLRMENCLAFAKKVCKYHDHGEIFLKNGRSTPFPRGSPNPISTLWPRDTLYTCDGFSAIRYFPLLFKVGNGNVTILYNVS